MTDYVDTRRKAATHEPAPTGNGHVVVTELLKDILARDEMGREKYGTSLRTDNGRGALMDALQEALDLCFYLKQAIMERDMFEEQSRINFAMSDISDDIHKGKKLFSDQGK